MSSIHILLILLCVIYYIYKVLTEKNSYWIKKKVIQCKPWPFFGNFAPQLFQITSLSDLLKSMYDQFPNARYFGMYQFLTPNLVIKDLDLIKRITVKDFDTFPEHQMITFDDTDPLFAKSIFLMKGGEKWQRTRSMLSPAFTSSKLKAMYPFLEQCAQQLLEYFKNNDGVTEIELKELFSKYSMDVIATVAFGVECNTFANPDHKFFVTGKRLIDLPLTAVLKRFMHTISPSIMRVFRLSIFPKDATNFFRNIVIRTMRMRDEKGIIRPDMLHMVNEARKGRMQYDEEENKSDSSFAIAQESEIGKNQKFKYSDFSDDDLIAQAFIFLLAGLDTISSALSFCAYELAINPDVQRKLRDEIDQQLTSKGGDFITYEELLSMKYLDMVVTETLRKWPLFAFINRHSVKPFTIEAELPGEETVNFPKGTVCLIPVHSIHTDPKYYPNPDKFDPERFSDQNKHLLNPLSFLTFGMGPKNCIGSRLALLEVKVLLFALLSKFELVPVSKTHIPMVIRKKGVVMVSEGGFWLGIKKRNR